jgi:DNA-binding response OmpR family regulator
VHGKTVLVVDDDADLLEMVRTYLTREEFFVLTAGSSEDMTARMAEKSVSLVLLDLNLGREDGLTVLRDLRQVSEVPVIILTGKGDMVDKIVGLEVGADDYVVKPFHLRELLARIRSVLRRTDSAEAVDGPPARDDAPAKLHFMGWTLDLRGRILLSPEAAPVELTTMEFNLLAALAMRPNQALTRDQLLDMVTGREMGPMDRSIDVHIANLRRKIEPDPKTPVLIKTLRGTGYIFTPHGEAR